MAIALFRAIRHLKRGLQALLYQVARLLAPLGRLIVSWLILPIYRLAILIKFKSTHLAEPTRGAVLSLVSNRYLFHGVFGIAALATIILNIQTGQALAQDVGHNSLLYALATNSEDEIVQETAGEYMERDAHYLDESALIAVPHVDFDYDEEEQALASIAVPGAISALPSVETGGRSNAPRTNTETYVVQSGDTVASIAYRFGVNVGTILWANGLTERQYIRPGDKLKIPPVSGVLAVVKKGDTIAKLAKKYGVSEKEIVEFNKITADTTLALGMELVIPGGKPPAAPVTVATSRTGQSSTGVKPSDADTSRLASTQLLWPTSGRVITQYYGWRHTGLDIDGTLSSPLYAAQDGVVEVSGWNSGGYGLQVLIRHPNGMKTRYAHASKLYVTAGQQVKRGQVIAMMGNTGRSTGSHLHFEVYVGGVRRNRLSYIR